VIPVDPEQFAVAMHKFLSDHGQGDTVGPDLIEVWERFATLLNRQATAPEPKLPVWGSELGSGKSVGTRVYASLLPEVVGMLVVVRQRTDAAAGAQHVNQLAGRDDMAAAYYSYKPSEDSDTLPPPTPLEELAKFQVVFICHEGYERGLSGRSAYPKFAAFHKYGTGRRALVVVDEALNQIVEFRATYDLLNKVASTIPTQLAMAPNSPW
jgi:hypothetical protein